jgi:hypothetical protein
MLIKAGVDISKLRPQIRKKLNGIEKIYKEIDEELVITSTYEGNHCAGSIHYEHLAVDIRRPQEGKPNIHHKLTNHLGADYDIVFEIDHIHIEYDPL